jgi:hypothetical protein
VQPFLLCVFVIMKLASRLTAQQVRGRLQSAPPRAVPVMPCPHSQTLYDGR